LWARRFYRRLCSGGNIVFCHPQSRTWGFP
jgi:hypothetical protein